MRYLEYLLERGRQLDEDDEAIFLLAKKFIKVRTRQSKLVPLIANAAQREFERRKTQQNIVLKARQMGMTTWIAARFFLKTVTHPGTLTVQVAQSELAVQAIFRSVQRMWDNLPRSLREGPLRRSRANVGQMVFPALDSEFRVWTAGDRNAGRGLTIHNLHCSEVSRWPGDSTEILAGLRACLAPDGELVLESTPNGATGAFYREWQTNELTRHFLPWWMEEEYVGPRVCAAEWTLEENKLAYAHGLSEQQIGYRRSLEKRFGKMRSQEFAEDAETCFRATGECYFEVDAIDRRLTELDWFFEQRRNGRLLIWFPPMREREYVVSVDTAGGEENGDFSAVQVLDLETGAQCAELQEKLAPLELARVTAELAREYGGATVAVERNNHGAAVLAHLERGEGYTKIYQQKGKAGWLTSVTSKPLMLGYLAALLVEQPQIFHSRRLLGECRTFVNSEGKKLEAKRGAHDDTVIAMAIGQMVRREWMHKKNGKKNFLVN